MKIAYLVNQYPKISHVFIRREILAVEKEGNSVLRFGIRRCAEEIVSPLDVEEARKTHTLLDAGWLGLLQALVLMSFSRFGLFSRAFLLAIRVGIRSDRGLLRHVVYLAEACVLFRRLAREDVQHLHAHFGTNSATVAMLCRELGGPTYSFTAHGPEEFDNAPLLGLRQKIARASFVAAITSYARSQLYRHCDFRQWPKIKLVRCGVDDDFLGPPPLPMPASRRLVSIGRLCEQKGQLLLIEALARLHREGRCVDLVLIGDGDLRGEIEAAIQRGNLEGSVRILGWADTATVAKTLDDGCALVLPSFAEGLPVVIMEAFARARPVLSTFVAGIPELVVPGRNGWLVPAGSVDALALGLGQILDTPLERLAEMGLRGREDVIRMHEIGAIARGMVAHFQEAIASQSEPAAKEQALA
jgi:glycosyltransferase involved in cell wall biosynthesis